MTSERELDHLLARAAEVPAADAETLAELGRMTRAARPRRRRPVVIVALAGAMALGGVVAFSGAITQLAVDLTTPPFQELPDGWLRTNAWIPVEWVQTDGHEERCRTYLEVENGDAGMIEALDAAIAGRDWSGLGQSLYEALPGSVPADEIESEVNLAAQPIIQAFALDAVPELTGAPGSPGIGALATTCRTDL